MPIPVFPTVVSNAYPKFAGKRISNPSRSFNEGIRVSTIVFVADSSHEQRRQRSLPKKTFQLSWLVLTAGEYYTIRDFFLQVQNSVAFNWRHPLDGNTYLVKFTNDTFMGENFSHNLLGPLFKLQVSLEQVWS